jgi:alpha-L-arabinofuranosidase
MQKVGVSKRLALIAAVFTLLVAGFGSIGTTSAAYGADALLFGESLSPTWQSWSWSSTVNTGSTNPVGTGSRALGVQITAGYGALSLRTSPPVDFGNGTITFQVHGGSTGANLLLFTGQDDGNSVASNTVTISAPANAWTTQTVTAAQLGSPARIARLNISSSTPVTFSLDELRVDPGQAAPTTVAPTTLPPVTADGNITINAAATQATLSNRMWGSNMGFYSGPYGYADPTVRARTKGMTGLTRYPGGQDSQRWGWASCQAGVDIPNAQGCTNPNFTWTAKPSDFIGFMQAIGGEAVVTMNINATAKENAALVAFFNGVTTDSRLIGVDQRGADWKTVGYWAQQRTNAGYPNPLGVKLWEFGNETFGGLPGGTNCVSYGWEVTWTCKATDFLDGLGAGATRRDGYRATKAQVKAVDASILLGFPAEKGLDDYNGWTREAIANHRGDVDFFVVHPYFYWIPPANTDAGNAEILSLPQRHWKTISDTFDGAYNQYGSRRVPLLISEFNLTPGPQNDPAKRMNGVGNALMMADSVGAMTQNGLYLGANAFELYGPPSADGTYFGMLRRDGAATRAPLYWGWVLWSRFGSTMLQATSTFDAGSTLSVYAGRKDGNTLSLYVINKTSRTISAQVNVNGVPGIGTILSDAAVGTSMTDTAPTFNGQSNPNDDLSSAPASASSANGQKSFIRNFAPWSMTLLRMTIDGSAPPTTASVTTVPPTTTPITTTPITTTPITTTPITTTPITTTPITTVPTTTTPVGSGTCSVVYKPDWQSTAAFGGNGTITNTGTAPIDGWTLTFSFAGNQTVYQSWGSTLTQTAQQVTIKNASWNGYVAPGSSQSFGFAANYSGTNTPITGWKLNGANCS